MLTNPNTHLKQWYHIFVIHISALAFYPPNAGLAYTVYPKKYAHGFVVLCFVVVMQSFIMNSHEVFIHIHQGCFAGTGAIVRLPQCQWSKPAGYGKISQYITITKHSKAKTVCIFLGIYCMRGSNAATDLHADAQPLMLLGHQLAYYRLQSLEYPKSSTKFRSQMFQNGQRDPAKGRITPRVNDVITSYHWGRMTHICGGKLTTIVSDNGLSHGRCQAISSIFVHENVFQSVVCEIRHFVSVSRS